MTNNHENPFATADTTVGQNPTATTPVEMEIELGLQEKPMTALHRGVATMIAASLGEDRVKPLLAAMARYDAFKSIKDNMDDIIGCLMIILEAIFQVELSARVLQINNQRPGVTPKKFRLIALHFPILAAYGECFLKGGAHLVPRMSEDLIQKVTILGFLDEHKRARIPEWYLYALAMFHSYGLRFCEGLPVEITVDDPTVYGLDIGENDEIVGPESLTPNPEQIMISLFVRSTQIANLLGAYAVQYDHLTMIINTLFAIGQKSVHVEQNS